MGLGQWGSLQRRDGRSCSDGEGCCVLDGEGERDKEEKRRNGEVEEKEEKEASLGVVLAGGETAGVGLEV